MDYALRRDKAPTRAQGRDLIDRFIFISPLSYYSEHLEVRIEDDHAVGFLLPNCSLSEDIREMFERHVMTLNCLFEMLTSKELQT